MQRETILTWALRFQALYYMTTGFWPFVHLESFVAVVGPKPDVFQLHVTAALIVVVGAVLLYGSRQAARDVILLSVLSAATFIGLEVGYARQLREVFWLDTVVEAAIIGVMILFRKKPAR